MERTRDPGRELRTELVTLTPELASQWLMRNRGNRHLRKGHAERIADSILRGEWKLNGDTLKFSATGRLLDGQHRLTAVVLAGTSVDVMVVHNLDDDVQPTYGDTAPRTAADELVQAGYKGDSKTTAATLKCVAALARPDRPYSANLRPSNTQARELLRLHPQVEESVAICREARKAIGLPVGVAAALHYLCTRIDPELAEEFFDKLLRGMMLRDGEPVAALRTLLLATQVRTGQGRQRLRPEHMVAYFTKAWNAARAGRDIKHLKLTSQEAYPRLDGLDDILAQGAQAPRKSEAGVPHRNGAAR